MISITLFSTRKTTPPDETVLYSIPAATKLVADLNEADESGWTYKLKMLNGTSAVISVYDDEGVLLGTL